MLLKGALCLLPFSFAELDDPNLHLSYFHQDKTIRPAGNPNYCLSATNKRHNFVKLQHCTSGDFQKFKYDAETGLISSSVPEDSWYYNRCFRFTSGKLVTVANCDATDENQQFTFDLGMIKYRKLNP